MTNLKVKPYNLDDEAIKWVEDTISNMSIEEKIGQLNLLTGGEAITGTTGNSDIEKKVRNGQVGGFFERLVRGTWAGHVVEHVAIELQCLSGHEVAFGKTYSTEEIGIYNIVYRYVDEATGLRAGEMAVELIEKIFEGQISTVDPLLKELSKS